MRSISDRRRIKTFVSADASRVRWRRSETTVPEYPSKANTSLPSHDFGSKQSPRRTRTGTPPGPRGGLITSTLKLSSIGPARPWTVSSSYCESDSPASRMPTGSVPQPVAPLSIRASRKRATPDAALATRCQLGHTLFRPQRSRVERGRVDVSVPGATSPRPMGPPASRGWHRLGTPLRGDMSSHNPAA
jgi:hypothetical protein